MIWQILTYVYYLLHGIQTYKENLNIYQDNVATSAPLGLHVADSEFRRPLFFVHLDKIIKIRYFIVGHSDIFSPPLGTVLPNQLLPHLQ